MTITIIAAMTNDRVIADSGTKGMLWYIPEELKHFRKTTLGKTCIVGRKTAEQMPILKDRTILVMSNTIVHYDENNYFHGEFFPENMQSNLSHEFMVIGGAEIYDLFLPYADKVVLSVIDIDMKGDKLFPELDCDWDAVSVEPHEQFIVFTYIRRKS